MIPEVYRLHYSKDPEDPLARRIRMALDFRDDW